MGAAKAEIDAACAEIEAGYVPEDCEADSEAVGEQPPAAARAALVAAAGDAAETGSTKLKPPDQGHAVAGRPSRRERAAGAKGSLSASEEEGYEI